MRGQEIVLLIIPLFWFWITGTLLVAYVAGQKNRSPLGWALLSLIVSPLFALIALAAVPNRTDADDGDERASDDETTARIRRM